MPAPTSTAPASSLYPLAILDVGSSSLRLTVQPAPPTTSLPAIHTAPNAILRTRGNPGRKVHIGSAIEEKCSDFSGVTLRLPIERGFLTDWVAQKAIWDVEIGAALSKVASGSKHQSSGGRLLEGWNLIITEAYFNLPEIENGLETMWFEEYGVKGIWRTTGAQLASYAPLSISAKANEAVEVKEEPNLQKGVPLTALPEEAATSKPPKKRGRPSLRMAKQNENGPPTADRKAKGKGSLLRLGPNRRPEATVILDLGNSYTHVVPIVHSEVIWKGVRRLDVGGKMMTNLLKEMISFKQWDMMEESWIVSHLKEKALFVAASAFDEDKDRPSGWSRVELLKVEQRRKGANPIQQEFVLPDFTDSSLARDMRSRYGRVRQGPGYHRVSSIGSTSSAKKAATQDSAEQSALIDQERDREDQFIADMDCLHASEKGYQKGSTEADEDDEDEDDEDAGEDYQESGSDSETEVRPSKTAARPVSVKRKQDVTEDEEEQVITLSCERWQIPELLFNPQQIGLQALGLPELIKSAVWASSEDEGVRGLMLSSVILVGGLANLPGLRRRLETDLRSLVPDDFLVRVRTPAEPDAAAMYGALHLPKAVLSSKLITKEEWEKAGAGTPAARERFRSWSSQAARTPL